MKPPVYPCEACGTVIPQSHRGRIKRTCSEKCGNWLWNLRNPEKVIEGRARKAEQRRSERKPTRTHCVECGAELERPGALRCPPCRVQVERERGRERTRRRRQDPVVRAKDAEQVKQWKARNPEKVRQYKSASGKRNRVKNRAREAEYRRKHRSRLNEYVRERRAADPDENRRRSREYYRSMSPERREEDRIRRRAYRTANSGYVQAASSWYREDRAIVTTSKAINQGSPWTPTELLIALDASRTETEAALLIGRTAHAVAMKRSKVRRAAVVNPKAVNTGKPWTEAEARIAADPNLTQVDAALRLGRSLKAVGLKRSEVRRAQAASRQSSL